MDGPAGDARIGTQPDLDAGPWLRIAALAAIQHGVVSRAQMQDAGLSTGRITRATRAGLLHRTHRSVYAVGYPALTASGCASAAVLACGARSALGYRSAGAHHGLRPRVSPRVEVVVASTARPEHSGVVVHRHPDLWPDETEVRDGIRTTTVARTQLDLGAVLSPSASRKVVAQAELLRVFDLREVELVLERHPRHRGAAALRRVLASWEEPPRTRSPQEEAFPELCARLGLPRPVMNATVLGMEIDALFPDHGVAVELDSWRFHQGVLKWEEDHERRNHLTAAGWLPVAFTYREQRDRGGLAVLETLGPALERGRARPVPRR